MIDAGRELDFTGLPGGDFPSEICIEARPSMQRPLESFGSAGFYSQSEMLFYRRRLSAPLRLR